MSRVLTSAERAAFGRAWEGLTGENFEQGGRVLLSADDCESVILAVMEAPVHGVEAVDGFRDDPGYRCYCGLSGDRQWMHEHLRWAGQDWPQDWP